MVAKIGDLKVISRTSTVAQATAFMARVPASVDPQGQVRFVRYKISMRTRDFAKAVTVLDGAPDWILTDPVHRPVATAGLRGVALEAVGDTAAAHREFEAAIQLLEKQISAGRSEPSIHAALGRAYAGLDRRNDAVREATKAIELLPVSQDAFDGTFYLYQSQKFRRVSVTRMRRFRQSVSCSTYQPVL